MRASVDCRETVCSSTGWGALKASWVRASCFIICRRVCGVGGGAVGEATHPHQNRYLRRPSKAAPEPRRWDRTRRPALSTSRCRPPAPGCAQGHAHRCLLHQRVYHILDHTCKVRPSSICPVASMVWLRSSSFRLRSPTRPSACKPHTAQWALSTAHRHIPLLFRPPHRHKKQRAEGSIGGCGSRSAPGDQLRG